MLAIGLGGSEELPAYFKKKGVRWMTIQELREKQLDLIAEVGGYWHVQDIGNTYNLLNRVIIRTFSSEHEKTFWGLVNLSDEKIEALLQGEPVSIYEEYTGQKIYNFACEFIVPSEDKELESLIKQWNVGEQKGNLMNRIFKRVGQIGGYNFIWA